MHIEVVYALPDQQYLVHVELPHGSTVGQALDAASRVAPFSGLDLTSGNIGVFGRLVDRATVLHPEDRVEIYRPLRIDPRQARRQRGQSEAH